MARLHRKIFFWSILLLSQAAMHAAEADAIKRSANGVPFIKVVDARTKKAIEWELIVTPAVSSFGVARTTNYQADFLLMLPISSAESASAKVLKAIDWSQKSAEAKAPPFSKILGLVDDTEWKFTWSGNRATVSTGNGVYLEDLDLPKVAALLQCVNETLRDQSKADQAGAAFAAGLK